MAAGSLSDVRILDLSDEIGSYCTRLLADLGADVIKVEPPEGAHSRRLGQFVGDIPTIERSISFLYLNANKRSVSLNLHAVDGRQIFKRLVQTADIVVEDAMPGYLDSLGLGFDELVQAKPDIILCSITGFGQSGPHAHFEASDIVAAAMSGVMTLAGEPFDPPNLMYGNQSYYTASIAAAQGILLALCERDLSGDGQHVDVSMQEALLMVQELAVTTWDFQKQIPERAGSTGDLPVGIPGNGCYDAMDGHVICSIAAPVGAQWSELLQWTSARVIQIDS